MNQLVSNSKHEHFAIQPWRRGAIWWKLLLALVLLLVIFVVMLPTLVSWGLAHGLIRSAIARQVNGDVTLGDIRAGWFSDQTINDFVITSPAGEKAVDVDATLHAGLFDIVLGKVDRFEIDLAGELSGTLHEDGSLSFTDLLKHDPSKPQPPPAPAPGSRSPIPGAVVNIDSLFVTLYDEARKETITLDDVTGNITLDPGDQVIITLDGTSFARGETGSFHIEATTDGAIDETGAFTPAGAVAALSVTLQRVPLVFSKEEAIVHALEIEANSSDLTQRIDLTLNGKAQMQGANPSSLSGVISIDTPFNSAGAATISLASITGSITGTRVPSALLQPLIAAGSPIRLERDLGPVVDVNADFSAGESKQVEIRASADAVQLELVGAVNTVDKSFTGDKLTLTARIDPQLAQDLANIGLDQPAQARAEFSRIVIPALGEAGLDIGAIALSGTVAIDQAVAVTLPGEEPRTLQVHSATVNVESEALRDLVRASGTAAVDELTMEFDESIAQLVDDSGKIAFDKLVPEGTVRVAGITDNTVHAFLPGIADLVSANKVTPVTAEVRTRPSEAGWSAELSLSGNKLGALATAQRAGDTITVQIDNVDMRVSPALVAHLQQDSESPAVLMGPAQLQLVSEPIKLPAAGLADVDFAAIPLHLRGRLEDATFDNVPSFKEPVLVTGFEANIGARLEPERWYSAVGTATLAVASDAAAIANVEFDITLAQAGERMAPTGTIALNDLSVPSLERATGRAEGAFSTLVGSTGDVRFTLAREGEVYQSNIDANLENLTGSFAASLSEQLLSVTAETSKFTLSQKALNQFLAKAAPPEAAATQDSLSPELLTATSDLPLDAQVRSLQIPVGALEDEAIDPALVEIDIALTGGPVTFVEPTLGTLKSQSLSASIRSKDLADGVQFEANLVAEAVDPVVANGETPEPTHLTIAGTLTNLLDSESRVATEHATLDMTAEAKRIPTAIVDALASWNGLLVAALGPQVEAMATAEQFSLDTGKLSTRFDASNGWMEGIVKGREGVLHLSQANPLRAELNITPALRDRLLYKIHPILADIRTTEQPLRIVVPSASVPVSGDVSGLNARIEITVGAVELDGGSTSLFLLKLVNSDRGATIPGMIDPIVATITNGVLTYEKFSVHVDKYRMDYSGTIDLNTGSVNLRTELPLDALSTSIEELRGITDNITVPIVTRGSFGNLKTQIDPSFDVAKEALKGGLRGTLEDLLNRGKRDEDPAPDGGQDGGGDSGGDGAGTQEPKDDVMDLLDTILRGVGGRKANQSDAARANGGQRPTGAPASPRRRQ